jgi:hypothetical protein
MMAAVTMFPVPAQANPIVWSLQGVMFDDLASATGSFTYDALTGTYSRWNISVTAGPNFTAYTYQPVVDQGFFFVNSVNQVDFVAFPSGTTGRFLHLTFLSPLTDAGGTIALSIAGMGADRSLECNNCGIVRFITGGAVTSVPEPSTLTLVGSAVLIGGLIKRLRTKRSA